MKYYVIFKETGDIVHVCDTMHEAKYMISRKRKPFEYSIVYY